MGFSCGCSRPAVRQPHIALALRAAAPDGITPLWGLVAEVLSPHACVMQYQPPYVLVLLTESQVATGAEWFRLLPERLGPVSGGYSAAYIDAAALEHAQAEALSALSLGERLRGPGHLVAYGEVFPLDYATRLIGDPVLDGVYNQVVRALCVPTQARGVLLATLEAFLANGCSLQATANVLGVHRNTVLYRLKRTTELTGLNLQDLDVRFLVQLALRARDRLGRRRTDPAHLLSA